MYHAINHACNHTIHHVIYHTNASTRLSSCKSAGASSLRSNSKCSSFHEALRAFPHAKSTTFANILSSFSLRLRIFRSSSRRSSSCTCSRFKTVAMSTRLIFVCLATGACGVSSLATAGADVLLGVVCLGAASVFACSGLVRTSGWGLCFFAIGGDLVASVMTTSVDLVGVSECGRTFSAILFFLRLPSSSSPREFLRLRDISASLFFSFCRSSLSSFSLFSLFFSFSFFLSSSFSFSFLLPFSSNFSFSFFFSFSSSLSLSFFLSFSSTFSFFLSFSSSLSLSFFFSFFSPFFDCVPPSVSSSSVPIS
eukprot:Colp12_sorted_trinity150504_noHs@14403